MLFEELVFLLSITPPLPNKTAHTWEESRNLQHGGYNSFIIVEKSRENLKRIKITIQISFHRLSGRVEKTLYRLEMTFFRFKWNQKLLRMCKTDREGSRRPQKIQNNFFWIYSFCTEDQCWIWRISRKVKNCWKESRRANKDRNFS